MGGNDPSPSASSSDGCSPTQMCVCVQVCKCAGERNANVSNISGVNDVSELTSSLRIH